MNWNILFVVYMALAGVMLQLDFSSKSAGMFVAAAGDVGVDGGSDENMDVGEPEEDVTVEDEVENFEDVDSEEPEQPEVDVQQLGRVFQMLTTECKEEMQRAYTEKTEDVISEACRMQIQNAFIQDTQRQAGAGGAEEAPKELGDDPTPYIVAFLVICFLGVGVKVFNIQQELSKAPARKKKPLSKQKALKQKIKEQRRQQG
mmetsp:Transcript_1242/g.1458  ORF Transcript_1242/g.1458 Transcript_1242/m.1458 type:complete len:202 (-) Transcript_1242:49-654(-)